MNCGCAEVVTPTLLGLGMVRDAPRELHRALARARAEADLVLWSGEAPVARLAGGQGSHMLRAASQAHGYLLIDADTDVEEGHAYGYCPAAQFGH
ncbi:hypothetical protein [Halomonas ramblicola]|uniref:hypothetical protein n=1 Tax=Halomonas ramblicola TaxID=747349 RepID=UPI0025B2FCA0|nr:hypothetical protein [Halomonas ramblicola]MDN3523001.1 hypothetical protein [Halomonas ramblicola]